MTISLRKDIHKTTYFFQHYFLQIMVKLLFIRCAKTCRFLVFLFLYCNFSLLTGQDRIQILVNGSAGGIVDGNLSSYLIGPGADQKYICLDAGTLINGFSRLKPIRVSPHFQVLVSLIYYLNGICFEMAYPAI